MQPAAVVRVEDDTDVYIEALCELKEEGYEQFQDIDLDHFDNRTCKDRIAEHYAEIEESEGDGEGRGQTRGACFRFWAYVSAA